MVDTNIMIEKLKRMMAEVLELRDQKPEAQRQAIEMLKGVINTLHLGRKTGSKQAANAASGFDTPATEYLYNLKPDLEVGTVNDGDWFGLYLGDLAEDNEELQALPEADRTLLKRNHGAIIRATVYEVSGQFFPQEEDAVDQWEETKFILNQRGSDATFPYR